MQSIRRALRIGGMDDDALFRADLMISCRNRTRLRSLGKYSNAQKARARLSHSIWGLHQTSLVSNWCWGAIYDDGLHLRGN